MVEMDENEVLNLRNIAGTVQKMLQNPATRGKLLEAQKIINPNAVIPELDATKPVFDELAAVRKQLADDKAERAAEKAKEREEAAMERLKTQWMSGQAKARQAGYTAEGLAALETFMEERGIADHEIAMPAFERLNPPAKTIEASGNRFDLFKGVNGGEDDTKLLLEGKEQEFLSKRINETLSGIRSGKF